MKNPVDIMGDVNKLRAADRHLRYAIDQIHRIRVMVYMIIILWIGLGITVSGASGSPYPIYGCSIVSCLFFLYVYCIDLKGEHNKYIDICHKCIDANIDCLKSALKLQSSYDHEDGFNTGVDRTINRIYQEYTIIQKEKNDVLRDSTTMGG